MATIDGTGRPGYMYDDATNVWYEISGKVSTAANYQWIGAHQFDNNVTNNGAITAKLKFNVVVAADGLVRRASTLLLLQPICSNFLRQRFRR